MRLIFFLGGGGAGGGDGHPDPQIRRGAVSNKIFLALLASVSSKNKGRAVPPGPSPGSATVIDWWLGWLVG